jgi:hypothetical protein
MLRGFVQLTHSAILTSLTAQPSTSSSNSPPPEVGPE